MNAAHMDEAINRRSLWLRVRGQLWWIPAGTAIGALAAVILYMGLWLHLSGQRQYRQTSKFYLTFAADSAGNVQDYYNDYTWNDLIFSVPAISQVLESELSDGVTMEQAREDIEAQILSDVRVLTIQVTDSDPQTVQELTNAMQDALVRYGHTAEQFQSIEFLSSGDVEAVTVKDRSQGAVVLGAILGLLISAAAVWLYEVLNGAVYCPEEASARYGLPVLFTLCQDEDKKAGALPGFLEKENAEAAKALGTVTLLVIAEEDALAEQTASVLQERYGIAARAADPAQVLAQAGNAAQVPAQTGKSVQAQTQTGTSAQAGNSAQAEDAAQVPTQDSDALQGAALCLAVPFGKRNAAVTEHLCTQLTVKGSHLIGLILAEADGSYLTKYYGRK